MRPKTMEPGKESRMERVNRILAHPLWQTQLKKIEELEKTRKFCGHNLDHLLHVARLAYIEALEQDLPVSKENIYAAALLHDIGRAKEYESDIPHHKAGAALAAEILRDCGFLQEDLDAIVGAIDAHRDKGIGKHAEEEGGAGKDADEGTGILAGLLYRADKGSRCCFWCEAAEQCNWPENKKNQQIKG